LRKSSGSFSWGSSSGSSRGTSSGGGWASEWIVWVLTSSTNWTWVAIKLRESWSSWSGGGCGSGWGTSNSSSERNGSSVSWIVIVGVWAGVRDVTWVALNLGQSWGGGGSGWSSCSGWGTRSSSSKRLGSSVSWIVIVGVWAGVGDVAWVALNLGQSWGGGGSGWSSCSGRSASKICIGSNWSLISSSNSISGIIGHSLLALEWVVRVGSEG